MFDEVMNLDGLLVLGCFTTRYMWYFLSFLDIRRLCILVCCFHCNGELIGLRTMAEKNEQTWDILSISIT